MSLRNTNKNFTSFEKLEEAGLVLKCEALSGRVQLDCRPDVAGTFTRNDKSAPRQSFVDSKAKRRRPE